MKRLKLVCFLILICLFTGCQDNSYESYKSYEELGNNLHHEENSYTDLYLEPFSFSSTINVFHNENGNLIPCAHKFDTPENNFLPLAVSTGVSLDKSLETDFAPFRIYVFGNGIPLDFCLGNMQEGEFSKVHELVTEGSNRELLFNIVVDLDVGKTIDIISIVCDYLPEHIPQKGLGLYSGAIVYSMLNTEFDQRPYIEDEPNFYFNSDKMENELDIGKNSLSETNSEISEEHFYDDIDITGDDDVYIKFNSGNTTDLPFYLILFRDGELIAPFDGNYSMAVDCKEGTRAFQYRIPDEFLGSDGLHIFRLMSIPAFGKIMGEKIDMPYYSTKKTRIQLSRGI